MNSALGILLTRHLVLARAAASDKDICNTVEHGRLASGIVAKLARNVSVVDAAHIRVVSAAVELGVRAARRRMWEEAWSLFDAVHTGGMRFTSRDEWDDSFFLDSFLRPHAERDDQLGGAIRDWRRLVHRGTTQ